MTDSAYISYRLEDTYYGRAVFKIDHGKIIELVEIWVENYFGMGHGVGTVKYYPDMRVISISGYTEFHKGFSEKSEQMARLIRSKAQVHL